MAIRRRFLVWTLAMASLLSWGRSRAAEPGPENPVGWRYDGSGVFPDTAPPTNWDPRTGRNILWKMKFDERYGWSNAQPIAVGNRLFVGYEATNLVCLDADTGRVLWRKDLSKLLALDGDEARRFQALAEEKRKQDDVWLPMRDELWKVQEKLKKDPDNAELKARAEKLKADMAEPVRRSGEINQQLVEKTGLRGVPWKTLQGYSFSTPITDGRRVYVRYATGAVAAVDLDGNLAWMRAFPYDGGNSGVVSPRLVNGKLIWTRPAPPEGKKARMMVTAVEADTGRTLWETPPLRRSQGEGACSPIHVRIEDVDAIVSDGGDVVRASDGALLAREVSDNTYRTPPFHRNVVFFSHGKGVEAVELSLGGADKVQARSLWLTKPAIGDKPHTNTYGGGVYYQGYVHMLHDRGDYYVLDAKTGKQLYGGVVLKKEAGEDKDIAVYGNLSVAGGLIYGIDQAMGRCVVLKPGPAAEIVARNGPLGMGTGSPFFQGRRIYFRMLEYVYCVTQN